jgi:hypothetical protein
MEAFYSLSRRDASLIHLFPWHCSHGEGLAYLAKRKAEALQSLSVEEKADESGELRAVLYVLVVQFPVGWKRY